MPAPNPPASELIRVMTFNILETAPSYYAQGELSAVWANRAAYNVEVIQRYRPHLIGFQEFEQGHADTYRLHLTGYDSLTTDSLGGVLSNAIFWRADKFEQLSAGMSWLSPTPHLPGAAWGASDPVTAAWVHLRSRASGRELFHLNTHLDALSEPSRVLSTGLILDSLAAFQAGSDAAVIITGDFNCNPGWPAYRLLMQQGFVDTYHAAGHGDSVESSTFHAFKGRGYSALDWGDEVFWRVDWILARGELRTSSCTIVRDAQPPLYASDHYPVVAELRLRGSGI
jgi:endonuclease/exonuclease/phosphatase family metal-dependent hydrolase